MENCLQILDFVNNTSQEDALVSNAPLIYKENTFN